MKIKAGRFAVPVLALMVMVASTASSLGGPATGKTNALVKTTTDKTKDAVRQGVEKADKAVTNVVHHIGVGAHKATDVATNVAAKVKVVVTNAVGEVTEAIKHATR